MNNNIDYDPYEFLNVPDNMNLKDFKEFCVPLLKLHHPDRGGNTDNFQKIKQCIKIITNDIKNGKKRSYVTKTFTELKTQAENYVPELQDPNAFLGIKDYRNLDEFNSKFNEKFMAKLDNNNTFVLMDKDKLANCSLENKNKDTYMKQRNELEKDLERTKNLFENGNFNPTLFNVMFERANPVNKEMKEYKEPSFSQLSNNINYCSIESENSDGGYSIINQKNNYNDLFKGSHSSENIEDVKHLENSYNMDTTIIDANSRKIMEERRKMISEVIHIPEGEKPTTEIITKSKENDFKSQFNDKLHERDNFRKPPSQPQPQSDTKKQQISLLDVKPTSTPTPTQFKPQVSSKPKLLDVDVNKSFKLKLKGV